MPSPPLKRITEAAIKVFSEKGFGKTTMEEVSKQANVSRPNIYRYVSNREELLKLVVMHRAKHILRELKPKKGKCFGILVDLFVQLVEYAQTDPIFLIVIEQAAPNAAQLLADDPDVKTSLNKIMMPIIKKGRTAGKLRNDVSDEEVLYWLHYQAWVLAREPKIHSHEEITFFAKKFIVGGLIKQDITN